VLLKVCKCGIEMEVKLRTVIYSNKVEIDNVPIFSCSSCNRSEVLPEVKPDLTGLIATLGVDPERQSLLFNDINEVSNLMFRVSEKDQVNQSISAIIEERVNQLLDMLLLAGSIGDQQWADEIRNRLSQIASYSTSGYRM